MKDKILKKNLPVIIVSTLVLVLGIVGLTLALTNGMSSNVVIDTANLVVEYSGNLTLPSTNLFPIEDSEIDTNTENVLTVNFTVKGVQSNPTDIPIIYDIVLSDLNVPEELKSEYLKWQLKKNGSIISTGSFAKSFDTIKDGRLTLTEIQQDLPSYNATADSYEFKLWISESCPGDTSNCGPEKDQSNMLNKTLSGKIEAVLYTKSKKALVRVPDTSRSSSEMLAYLGLTSNGELNSVTAVATTNEGIYETQDDYGTTYFFRGAADNNYVYFANHWWRVVRINGDGSIRMIYDGTTAHANGENSYDRYIGGSAYNYTYGDNAYVGYMMGIDNQCTSDYCEGSTKTTSYEQATTNTYSSTIKTYIDSWYETNIEEAGYSDYLADVIYCNDREVDEDLSLTMGGTGTYGYGENVTVYEPSGRIIAPDGFGGAQTNQIKMTCSQKNDAFTVDDITNGNGALTYPVGLITSDELVAAGAYTYEWPENYDFYLYTGHDYWTMSPDYFYGDFARVWLLNDGGNRFNYFVINTRGVRPVVSLRSDVQLSGSGTMTDPWTVN